MDTPDSPPDGPEWPAGPPIEPPAGPPSTPPPPGAPPPQPAASGQAGMPAPPPPPGNQPGMVTPSGSYSAADAVGFGWRATRANLGVLIAAGAIYLVGTVLLQRFTTIAFGPSEAELLDALDDGFGALLRASTPPWWVTVVSSIGTTLLLIPLVRAALAVTAGRKVRFGELFAGDAVGQVALVAVILGLVSGITSTLPLLGFPLSLVMGFLTAYAMFFVIADGREAIDALVSSARFAIDNVGAVIVLFLLSLLVFMLGVLACLIGIFVAFPVAYVAQAYTFRYLRGEAVAAL